MVPRRSTSHTTRVEAARAAYERTHAAHAANGDETTHRNAAGELNYIGNYSKGLPHTATGEVLPDAYRKMLRALSSHAPADFDAIPLGAGRKFVNPQAGLAFDLQGPDSHAVTMPPAPRIDSAEMAGEMVELYWMALLRDVYFGDYATHVDVAAAAASLTALIDFRGPTDAGGTVTAGTLFRGSAPGDLVGPYVSQFLLRRFNYGTLQVNQRQRTAAAGVDYMMDVAGWLAVQNGGATGPDTFDPVRRYIRNGRDLATYVHFDALYEAYLNACLYLLNIEAPTDHGDYYRDSPTQLGFGTFGGPHILSLVTEVATRALKAVWHQKWFVHRRLRPEAFGGLVHHMVTGAVQYPLHADILDTAAGSTLDRVHARNLGAGHDTFLLPMAFPEGSPTHPAYGAGHATVAGACVTVLKAWFDESFVLPSPVVASSDGTALIPAPAGTPPLTVGGELDKVASNVAIGRNLAGVHWRTDYAASIRLGEAIALGLLEEQKLTYNEPQQFHLTTFDGVTVTI